MRPGRNASVNERAMVSVTGGDIDGSTLAQGRVSARIISFAVTLTEIPSWGKMPTLSCTKFVIPELTNFVIYRPTCSNTVKLKTRLTA